MRFLLTVCLLLTSTGARAQALQAAPPPFPTAAATFVLDLDSSRILESKNANARMFPASTTKIMTCLVAMERGNLNQVIRAGKNAANTGESGIGLLEGENHTLRELIEAALVHSANDACVDIAEGVGGSQQKFVGWMNQKARELGCRNTHFVNPHGLHDPNHYTTAHDLAVIARAALRIPFISEVARTKVATIGGNWKIGPTRVMINRNKLLFRWNQCDGFKTGYTRQAGNCLVASATKINPATRKPWRILAVAMKTAPGKSFSDCQTLLQTAFNSYQPQRVVERGEILAEKFIKGGAFALEAATSREVFLPMTAFERQTLTRRIHLLDLTAPLQKGAVVGNIEYLAVPNAKGNAAPRRLAQITLVARGDVPQTLLARAVPAVGNRFGPISLGARLLFLGLFCSGAAFLLLFKRKNHVRRRKQSAFKSAALEPRSASQPVRNRADRRPRN
ncbi:D-alanyl-D-alanine carboxypeptidase (penicillin-binding protein 5/6) [Abditibacterium utsteinense]|uniref:serine-type D-Ala-D-Ala carboxypeptidase n=1 Tax=Abditibacterium utsteinense TaxID=1960156 RepID=A0A2S8SW45_9BACT|nr:D-alanyl-D-alanine carboxypeptidase family protein [Abditibacterium utsteinense]PQV65015.1 D-alanyl-D-alanine carboxypeptidase (penicillin-binding protein 5/6) [Abditibacterium utsteinense]